MTFPPFLRHALLPAAVLLAGFAARQAEATQYPLTVIDVAGRQVTIQARPERVALQDGRDISLLALLDRDNPFKRLAIWNNIASRFDPAFWETMVQKWPEATKIPDMGFSDNGQVNAEGLLAARPQLVVAQLRALKSLTEAGVVQRLESLRIPLLIIDSLNEPVANVPRSATLLGEAMDREAQAKNYSDFYAEHLEALQAGIAKVPEAQRPLVFVEALAGRQGDTQCCFTHGDEGWGKLVAAIGARNLGTELLGTKPSGDVTMETVIQRHPAVYVMSGSSRPGGTLLPFGYDGDKAAAQKRMATFEARPGFSSVAAAKQGQVYGIWHSFYNNNYNIVGLEYLAKFAYPDQFPELDPGQTWNTIITRFTQIPLHATYFADKAPALP